MGFLKELLSIFDHEYDLNSMQFGRIKITGEKIIVTDLSGSKSSIYEKELKYTLTESFDRGFYISVRERFIESLKNNLELRELNVYGELTFDNGEFTYTCYAQKMADMIIPSVVGDLFCKYVFKIEIDGKPMPVDCVRSFWKAQRISGVSVF